MPELEPLMTLSIELEEGHDLGEGPFGNRQVYVVKGGKFKGDRLKGDLVPGSTDWLLQDNHGVGRMDGRALLRTHDGAIISMRYFGVLALTPAALEHIEETGNTAYGDTYFMLQPRFETGHEKYSWLNMLVTVGEGRTTQKGVEITIYGLRHGP